MKKNIVFWSGFELSVCLDQYLDIINVRGALFFIPINNFQEMVFLKYPSMHISKSTH